MSSWGTCSIRASHVGSIYRVGVHLIRDVLNHGQLHSHVRRRMMSGSECTKQQEQKARCGRI